VDENLLCFLCKIRRAKIATPMPDKIYHGILFSCGAKPVFGRLGPPTSFDSPHGPIEQLFLGEIRTQMGWLGGRAFMVVENPVTLVLYNHFPFSKPY
jgi:hypothetical protein